ncbi:kappa-carrageenase [Coraliomargarita akajimensis]|uniref:Kappa-carrageenase n=1 Tax=Coraliomargarita akajimensis (strain DSM 45221 / IAM 15411 / JCM 23193 / KCTC 12865 / 04OKA010-24) TaxID=583355 RepID=D5EN32_CORAD|nr:kappa-carrageenase [Coraliomargarita akajimensis]ADE53467.1 Kappa-carrageenase [Coraliomargarita akajimensis DSM 45221]
MHFLRSTLRGLILCALLLIGSSSLLQAVNFRESDRDKPQYLKDIKNRTVQAQILYVGEHWIYLKRNSTTARRLPLGILSQQSIEHAQAWADRFQSKLSETHQRELLAIAATASPGQPLILDPDPSKQWVLKEDFSDEFSDTEIDEGKWTHRLKPWGERAWRAENVWQENGILSIQAKYEPHTDTKGNEYFYTVGILQTKQKTTYGYFEARIKGCSRFPGLCPAFWLYSNGKDLNPDYPHITYSEIDIVEMLQGGYDVKEKRKTDEHRIDMNLHTREMIDGVETWRRPQHWPEVCANHIDSIWDPRDDFHLYACENTPEKITWYVDGVKVAESPNHNWHLPMTLTLTMELRPPLIKWGGNATRLANPETATPDGFPTHMEVDYVRSWSLQ